LSSSLFSKHLLFFSTRSQTFLSVFFLNKCPLPPHLINVSPTPFPSAFRQSPPLCFDTERRAVRRRLVQTPDVKSSCPCALFCLCYVSAFFRPVLVLFPQKCPPLVPPWPIQRENRSTACGLILSYRPSHVSPSPISKSFLPLHAPRTKYDFSPPPRSRHQWSPPCVFSTSFQPVACGPFWFVRRNHLLTGVILADHLVFSGGPLCTPPPGIEPPRRQ